MESLSIKEIVEAVAGELLCGKEQLQVHEVGTNSKEAKEGMLFVPIIGERVDAHTFIPAVLEAGVTAVFTSKSVDVSKVKENQAVIRVKDTITALQDLAVFYRKKFQIPVIGITGSVGKTTTKEMIAAALETKYRVLKTAGNMNSQIGLPLTIFRIDHTHEVAVIEMGISEEGEMEKLARVAKPTHAVITNIGVSHIGQLGSKENIRKEKMNIINEFGSESTLFVNGTDEQLMKVLPFSEYLKNSDKEKTQNCDKIDVNDRTLAKLETANVVTFGYGDGCMYHATDVIAEQGHTKFTLRTSQSVRNQKHINIEEKEQASQIELQVLGEHNVYNALVAIAIANRLGIDTDVAKEGLKEYKPLAMRGDIVKNNGITIIDDTYNASPDSMRGGINILLELPDVKRHFAVLADVLELGEHSYACHYGVGEYIATKKVEEVVTIGQEAKAIAKAVQEKNDRIIVHCMEKNEEAIAYLKNNVKSGDAILVKGSRGMHTDEIVAALKA
ncbi:UDP-N-acetylmuramoyl-tripeptide--D-alanyl-D-alanine ligase [Anaerosporobacter faecicola]|uniref:UDP-N-acetylmuramoyl-tripeptide--D-alanyl-D- alanine ligase n=1 Tax=Anaerosporobacter faecicola TaxID=2718714 RepID=UPI0014390957|nr:UDP-N-acetylmuramoyl-tripeptide--D-alanyl-D-alanine ligase [Anaerosporobacter faecicola]